MKILNLELKGYKRLALNNINYLSMKMTSPLQLILGTNGSGKSSILRQMTPHPPEHREFEKNGFKRIIIEHNNSMYELFSNFESGQKHTFIKDNVILNNEGTITVQKDLVKEHFNITNDINNLILGKDLFTLMSTNKRKEWFLTLCDTDYDYAIKVYNKLKDRLRDVSGALKLSKKRLTIESEKLVKDEEEKRLLNEVNELHSILNILLENRKPLDYDLDLLAIEQKEKDNELIKLTNLLESIKDKVLDEVIDDNGLYTLICTCDLELYSLGNMISKYTEDFNLNEKKINILRKAEQNTISTITKELQTLEITVNNTIENLKYGTLSNPLYSLDTISNVKGSLIDLLTSLPVNSDRKYSLENLIINKEKLNKLKLSKGNLDKEINDLNISISHMEKHRDNPDLSCPSCNHKFSLGYSKGVYDISKTNKENKLISISKLNTEIINVEEYINSCTEYSNLMKQVIQVMNNTPDLNIYWTYIKENNLLYNAPSSIVTLLNTFENDINIQIDLNKNKLLYTDKKALLDSLKEVGTTDLTSLVKSNESISSEIEKLVIKQTKVMTDKKQYQSRKKILTDSKKLSNSISDIIKEKRSIFKNELETIRRTNLNNLIVSIQKLLALKVDAVDNLKTHRNLIDDISKQITILTNQESTLKELVTVLSPTDGLIAEGLIGFINSFIEQMNFFIKKIWSYPLIIEPCSFDNESSIDLDYKFPVIVKNSDNIIKDVAEGSTAMLDVINLAFRITAMQYLNLKHYPLGLDEWGSGFDSTHRQQAVNAIKALSDQNIFDQLFIISHYSESFGALSNPEICVLDSSNIELPKNMTVYNKHVIIE